jgi:uncharacterized membrane protein YedE/YeeE
MNLLTQPWPWYVSGPLIGLMVPILLLLGNKTFGISSSLRHICAACVPGKTEFFKYDWRAESWNLIFAFGIIVGGFVAGYIFENPIAVQISEETVSDLNAMGIKNQNGLIPQEIFNFESIFSLRGFILILVGGFFVGFGTRYAGGCTSGHSIMGLSNLQFPSLVATICFFIGGLIMTWFILPLIMTL